MPFRYSNLSTTTLSAAIVSTSATSITVTSGSTFPSAGDFTIIIDSEIMRVTGVSGTTWTVVRGEEGTTAATHSNGATVSGVVTQKSLQNLYFFDVRAYGAKGDGTTDDTTAFTSTRDAAGTNGAVFVPPGTYIVNGFNWSVAGQVWTVRGTIKAKSSAGAGFTISAADVKLEGAIIDGNLSGNASQSTGLTISATRAILDGGRITNTRGTCLTISSSHAKIQDVEIDNGNGTGVSIGAQAFSTVKGCYFHNLTTGVSILSSATNTRILDNRFDPANVTTQYTDSGTATLFLGNLPAIAVRTIHFGSGTPTGGQSGDLALGSNVLWANDAGTWRSVILPNVTGSAPGTPGGTPLNVARGAKGFNVTTNNVTIDGYTITGPGANLWENSYGVYADGVNNLTIKNCIIKDFGQAGIWLQNCTNILIQNCIIQDCVYAGILVLGVTKGTGLYGAKIIDCDVKRIGVQAHQTPDYNAYGIVATQDVGGTPSSDILIQDCLVTDVPSWHGIDSHGALRMEVVHNEIRRTARGIFLTAQASTERTISANVHHNLVTDPQNVLPNGSDSNTGITTYDTRTTTIANNNVGTAYSNIHNDSGSLSTGLTLTNNVRGETLPVWP